MERANEMISVIVPVYNASNYLVDCIESILAQTYQYFELILIDDGSKDNSLEICESYQKNYNHVIVVHQENAGVSAARNAGLSLAKGAYFCFVDSDDSIEAEMLVKLYNAIKANNADLSICGFKSISQKGVTEQRPVSEEIIGKANISKFVLEHYLEWMVSSPCGKLYKNIQYPTRKFDENISLGEDLKFNIQYVEKIDRVVIIEDCLYRYIDTEGSLTKNYKQGNYEAICNIYETTIQYLARVLKQTEGFSLENVNYKLFSFCISFMYQNLRSQSVEDTRAFISQVCDNVLLQNAIKNLPSISSVRKVYVWAIRRKRVEVLILLSRVRCLLG